MRRERIEKRPPWGSAPPVLERYEEACASFSWEAARRDLDGLPGGRGLNIAHEAVDRHAAGALADEIALRCVARSGEVRDLRYRELASASNRFAAALQALGVRKGDRVFSLLGRVPELYIAALGTWKLGAVLAPLFSAFGPEPIQTRMLLGGARALVTTPPLYARKIERIRGSLPALEHVILVAEPGEPVAIAAAHDLGALLREAPDVFEIGPTDPEDPAILHFTSGTTGKPKGAIHVHAAVVAHHATGRLALDLRVGDVFWCTADPGWVTGTSYGIIAPLSIGARSLVDESDFDAERWYDLLAREQVAVWYTAPTAVRMLMRAGPEAARLRDLSRLRFVASVGEPLNPEAVSWGREAIGLPIHDNWWQTETGGIMIANYRAMDIEPGSMGRPMPGVSATLVRRREGGGLDEVTTPGEEGEIALRPGFPSLFRGYLDEPERYARCFVDGLYLSGDLATRDEQGYFYFVGRADDIIKSSGHRIGPFEVESALMEHPAVAEVGVIGVPDPIAFERVKAFVCLHRGHEPSEALRRELLGFARARLGAVVAPKEIEFRGSLPRTRSGKIMRRLLKARELGLPEGDTSTLEGGS